MVQAAASGRAIMVVAPRRYGKTSVLLAAGEQLDALGHTVVRADLYAVSSIGELVVRLERAWAASSGRLRRAVDRLLDAAGVGLSLTGAGFSATLSSRPSVDPVLALHTLLALPERVATRDGRVVLILDEFQSVTGLEGVEGLMRSHMQYHHDVASYVFAGSETALMHAVFDRPDRPFYGQALRLRLGRPSRAALAGAVEDGFVATGKDVGEGLGPLLDVADGHPQRTMLLAHCLWEATAPDATADLESWAEALAVARAHVEGEVQALYDTASANQQRLLRVLAHGRSAYSGDALRLVGMERGSVTKTLAQLDRDGFTEPTDEVGPRLVDPLLGDWIRRRLPL